VTIQAARYDAISLGECDYFRGVHDFYTPIYTVLFRLTVDKPGRLSLQRALCTHISPKARRRGLREVLIHISYMFISLC
jgi:hypothetical protein